MSSLGSALVHAVRVLIGIVVALTVSLVPTGLLVVFQFKAEVDRCRLTRAQLLPSVARAVVAYRQREGFRPAKLEDLVVAGLLETLPSDPWGGRLGYERTGTGMRLWSLGVDGAPGGTGTAGDIACRLDDQFTPLESCR